MFNKFIWSDRFSVKVQKMDDQHKVLIGYINVLAETLENDDYLKIQNAFNNMAAYTVQHFKEEEEFFVSKNFPGADSHKLIHKKLLDSMATYDTQIKSKTLDKVGFYNFLTFWLQSHIVGIDQKYGDFVTSGSKAG